MIKFIKIQYKNFLSSGQNPIEIDLNATRMTYVIGSNGAGKSTFIDAISFALFGKTQRGINKRQLINSVNKRNCEVKVWFTNGSDSFSISRGILPDYLTIEKNSVIIEQDANVRDYQKYLEENIFGFDFNAFHQIVILGTSFVPFMRLKTSQRREFIEDLLDVSIFSKMGEIAKKRLQTITNEISSIDGELNVQNERIRLYNNHLIEIKNVSIEQIEKKNQEINQLTEQKYELDKNTELLTQEVIYELNIVNEKIYDIKKNLSEKIKHINSLKSDIRHLVGKTKVFDSNISTCPTCEQTIPASVKITKMDELKTEAKQLKDKLSLAESEEKILLKNEQDLLVNQTEINSKQLEVSKNQQKIHYLDKIIQTYQKDIIEIEKKLNLLNKEKTIEHKELLKIKLDLEKRKAEFKDDERYLCVSISMLKDDGIKSKLIAAYIPLLNKLMAKYLQSLDFFASFAFNDDFSETIKSRHYDHFTYDSFSAGERSKIDLAILFTWREIAVMRNSLSTNLLMLDETFDSSLDGVGIDYLLRILGIIESNPNIFILSHNPRMIDYFDRVLKFSKQGGFSQMEDQR